MQCRSILIVMISQLIVFGTYQTSFGQDCTFVEYVASASVLRKDYIHHHLGQDRKYSCLILHINYAYD